MSRTHPFGPFLLVELRTNLGVFPTGNAKKGSVMMLGTAS